MVRLAYKRSDVAHALDGSGFVVPAVDKTLMTACSWASSKWSRLRKDDEVIFRVSAGRLNDQRALEMDDDTLVKSLHEELTTALGISGSPLLHDVTRWTNAFPQYESGHAARINEVRRLLGAFSTLALAGASYDGVGIPACIESGTRAAEQVLEALRSHVGG
jgi:oxygen-dependent protoporphyrinogen oxidase